MPWYLPLILAGCCLVAWLLMRLERRKLPPGFPNGEIVYHGHGRLRTPTLFSESFNLSGRPDYVVRQNGEFLPVEVKSGVKSGKLYDSHRMQLVAEALLVEAEYGKRPGRGFIVYANGFREVSIRPKDVERLSKALQVMRKAKRVGDMPRVRASWYYCPSCPVTHCPVRRKKVEMTTRRGRRAFFRHWPA